MPKKSPIGELASAQTKAEFSEKLASYTRLTKDETNKLFPKKSDKDELSKLLEIVNASTDENTKKAELAKQIGNVSGAVLKLTKFFAP